MLMRHAPKELNVLAEESENSKAVQAVRNSSFMLYSWLVAKLNVYGQMVKVSYAGGISWKLMIIMIMIHGDDDDDDDDDDDSADSNLPAFYKI